MVSVLTLQSAPASHPVFLYLYLLCALFTDNPMPGNIYVPAESVAPLKKAFQSLKPLLACSKYLAA